ncbi:MAG: hypothetical protein DME24_25750, partial [Verrucomicrobia bacterium]
MSEAGNFGTVIQSKPSAGVCCSTKFVELVADQEMTAFVPCPAISSLGVAEANSRIKPAPKSVPTTA